MTHYSSVRPLLVAAACAGLASTSAAQGGWRQWDVRLRDGTHVEANPLGAPNDSTIAISVGGYEGHDRTVPRRRVAYLAARAPSLPPAPARSVCGDAVVRLDGRRTTGHVVLTRVRFSEGTITQRGVDIDLRDVAYIQFAPPCRRGGSRHD
jgi:hypothetical protein